MSKLELDKIVVPPCFTETKPKGGKLEECRKYYLRTGKQDRYIVVDNQNCIVDGYCFYLVAKEFGLTTVEVRRGNEPKNKWKRITPRCYVYGTHIGQLTDKVYVWRVPRNSDYDGYAETLTPGMKVYAKTKHGIAPIVIRRIEWSFVPPRQKMRSITKKSSG